MVSVTKELDGNLRAIFSNGAIMQTCPLVENTGGEYELDWSIFDQRMPDGTRWLDHESIY